MEYYDLFDFIHYNPLDVSRCLDNLCFIRTELRLSDEYLHQYIDNNVYSILDFLNGL